MRLQHPVDLALEHPAIVHAAASMPNAEGVILVTVTHRKGRRDDLRCIGFETLLRRALPAGNDLRVEYKEDGE